METQKGYKGMTRKEHIDLAVRAKTDKRAMEELLATHTGMMKKVVKQYAPYALSMTFDDLLQEASIGLMRAAERFDPSHGTTFITYATFWIRSSVDRAIANSDSFVRLPAAKTHEKRALLRLYDEFVAEYAYSPSDAELAALAGTTDDEVALLMQSRKPLFIDEEEVLDYFNRSRDAIDEATQVTESDVLTLLANLLEPDEFDLFTRNRGIGRKRQTFKQLSAESGEIVGTLSQRVRMIVCKLRHPISLLAQEEAGMQIYDYV